MSSVPNIRIQKTNDAPVHEDRDFVIYWMIASRRTKWNYGIQRAVECAIGLNKPLLVFEALRVTVGQIVTLTGAATCSAGTPEYRFWGRDPAGAWLELCPWQISPTCAWNTGVSPA